MDVSFDLDGADELDKLLAQLPVALENRIIKSGITAMGRHFVLHMRNTLNRKTDGQGDTARSIKNSSGGRTLQFVRIFGPQWHLLEFGTTDRFQKSGQYTGKIVDGKFSFVRPTLFTQTKVATANFEIKVRSEIERLGRSYL